MCIFLNFCRTTFTYSFLRSSPLFLPGNFNSLLSQCRWKVHLNLHRKFLQMNFHQKQSLAFLLKILLAKGELLSDQVPQMTKLNFSSASQLYTTNFHHPNRFWPPLNVDRPNEKLFLHIMSKQHLQLCAITTITRQQCQQT